MVATVIDLSRLPAPDAIEPLSAPALKADFVARFKTAWAAARALDPTLPTYDLELLESDPAIIVGEAITYLRLLDRARVNDAVRAVLAPLARGADLDNVVARWGVERLVVTPATDDKPAVMESDEQLLRRYLLAVDRPSAGSADRYLYEAYTACPGLQDAVVIGRVVHGRRGDVDVVISGPNGDEATTEQLAAVRAAVTASDVKPEATSVSVIRAHRVGYSVSMTLEVPRGPDPSLIATEARTAVMAAARTRLKIGAEVPVGSLFGAAYVPNVIRVRGVQPAADIPPEPYSIPVCTGALVQTEVKQ